MKRKARWWAGALWLLALGWVLGTTPTPLQATANTMQSASTRQVEPLAVKVQVTGSVVNLRAGPGLHHATLGQVQQGDELRITGSSRDRKWLQVTLDGESRWIYADLTDIDAEVQWELAVVTALPLTFEAAYENQVAHWEGTYRLEQWGSTIGAVLTSSRSPVQHYARQQPEILFTLPLGYRPALDLDWEVEGWPVTADGLPTADPAVHRTFTVRVSKDGTVRYLDNQQVEGVGYLRYTARLAWPRAGTAPNVCERHFSIRWALVSILNMRDTDSSTACAGITWEQLAGIKDLTPPSRYEGDTGIVEIKTAEDLAGLQGLNTAKIRNMGHWPAGVLLPVPHLEVLHVVSGSVAMDAPFFPPYAVAPPEDLLDYTPRLEDLRIEAVSVENFRNGFLASVPRLRTLHIKDAVANYIDYQELVWPDHVRLDTLLAPLPNLTELYLDVGTKGSVPGELLEGVPQLQKLTIQAPEQSVLPETFLTATPRLESLYLNFGYLPYLPATFLAETPSLSQIRLGLSLGDPFEWLLLYERLRQLNEDWLFDPDVRVGPGYGQVSVGRQQLCATWGSRLTCSPLNGSPYTLAERFGSVSTGDFHSCGVTLDHRIKCWDLQGRQQLEAPAGEFLSVSVGQAHNCAVRTDETVVCWGDNAHGQTDARSGSYQAVTAGLHHSCGLRTDNTIVCWGDNRQGQSNPPSGQFREVSAGGHFSCALDANKYQLLCWGDNSVGQTDLTEIHKIGARIRSLDAGFDHACAAFDDVGVRCWGSNDHGQLETPSVDLGKVSAGHKTTCGLTGGRRICWGWTGKPQDQVASGVGNWPYGLATTGIPLTTYRLEAGRPVFGSTDTDRSACPEQGPSPSLACDRELLLLIQESIGLRAHSGDEARQIWPTYAPIEDFEGVALSGEPPRVTKMSLSRLKDDVAIGGVLPAALGRLTHLQHLNLEGCKLKGSLPPELGQLNNLRVLDLSSNQLTGPIPAQLSQLANLNELDLSGNRLQGSLPSEIGRLHHLQTLDLGGNDLSGSIPPTIGQLTGLKKLDLAYNQFTGPIPPTLGRLIHLPNLSLNNNQLTGPIPSELGQLTNLLRMDLHNNQLTGPIPSELGRLTSLERMDLHNNQLTSSIHPAPGEFPRLLNLNLGHNQLSGAIPPELGQLPRLAVLNLEYNQLTSSIHLAPGGFPRLHQLNLAHNQLTGELPREPALLTGLSVLNLQANQFTGPIPLEWGKARRIRTLLLSGNQLTGPVPPALGQLIWLRTLDLAGNPISDCLPPSVHTKCAACTEMPVCPAPELSTCPNQGPSPSLACDKEILLDLKDTLWGPTVSGPAIWQADTPLALFDGVTLGGEPPRVIELHLGIDGHLISTPPLGGTIPPALARLPWLRKLHLQQDPQFRRGRRETTLLTGPIPPQLGQLALLEELVVPSNKLTGPIPPQLGQLTHLRQLLLPNNQLTGPIPPQLGQLPFLVNLNLSANQLTGSIPPQLGHLSQLVHLDFSANQLDETVPPELGQLDQLKHLDLSANQLTGTIPPELGKLADLEMLLFQGNQLTGPIPPQLGLLKPLSILDLSANQLTGTIPSELGLFTRLGNLDLSENQLSGAIPSELGQLTKLTLLDLSANQLTGTIPSKLGLFTRLGNLDLSENQLSGAIPPELGQLTKLTLLDLSANQLTGPIPPELGLLVHLEHLDLSANQLGNPIQLELGGSLGSLEGMVLYANQLTNTIPPELGLLVHLEHLDLSENQLTDPVPFEMRRLTKLKLLDLSSNQLTGPIHTELVRYPLPYTLNLRDNPITDCLSSGNVFNRNSVITDLGEETFCKD